MNTLWDARFYALAGTVSTWSKDPSTRVGAVLVGTNRRDIALGYNGFPAGIEDRSERLMNRKVRLRLTQHAERNVLDNAHFDPRAGSIYVTFFPCVECAKSIISRGVARVFAPPPVEREPWKTDAVWVQDLLREARVALIVLK